MASILNFTYCLAIEKKSQGTENSESINAISILTQLSPEILCFAVICAAQIGYRFGMVLASCAEYIQNSFYFHVIAHDIARLIEVDEVIGMQAVFIAYIHGQITVFEHIYHALWNVLFIVVPHHAI